MVGGSSPSQALSSGLFSSILIGTVLRRDPSLQPCWEANPHNDQRCFGKSKEQRCLPSQCNQGENYRQGLVLRLCCRKPLAPRSCPIP